MILYYKSRSKTNTTAFHCKCLLCVAATALCSSQHKCDWVMVRYDSNQQCAIPQASFPLAKSSNIQHTPTDVNRARTEHAMRRQVCELSFLCLQSLSLWRTIWFPAMTTEPTLKGVPSDTPLQSSVMRTSRFT